METSFSDLPQEVIAHIFLFLPYSSLLKARLVSRQWYAASLDYSLLKKEKLVIDARYHDQDSLITQLKECDRNFVHLEIVDKSSICIDEEFWFQLGPSLKSLHLSVCAVKEVDLINIFNQCVKLKYLGITNCHILSSQQISSDALKDMVNLEHLNITGYDFPHSNFKLFHWAAAKAPKLKKIVLVDCLADSQENNRHGLTFEHIMSYLKDRSDSKFDLGFDVSKEYMRDDELVQLAAVPNINLLLLETNFLPKPIYSTFQFGLQVLVLKANLFLNKPMFEAVCSNFPNLRKLTVDDMSGINTAVQKLSLLKNLTFLSLRLEYGYVEESDLFAGLCSEMNTNLKEFHLQIVNEMSSVFYVEFARTHPALTALSLSSSESLNDWTIQAFFKYLVFLESLSIREVNAVDIGWRGARVSAPLNESEPENPTGFSITRLKGLRILDISRSPIKIEILAEIISQMPTLEILGISQLPITDDFLELVVEKLPCLSQIDVFGCQKISKLWVKVLRYHGVRVLGGG